MTAISRRVDGDAPAQSGIGGARGFVVTGAVLATFLVVGAAPTPLYAVYAQR